MGKAEVHGLLADVLNDGDGAPADEPDAIAKSAAWNRFRGPIFDGLKFFSDEFGVSAKKKILRPTNVSASEARGCV